VCRERGCPDRTLVWYGNRGSHGGTGAAPIRDRPAGAIDSEVGYVVLRIGQEDGERGDPERGVLPNELALENVRGRLASTRPRNTLSARRFGRGDAERKGTSCAIDDGLPRRG